jgi:hypothetical protein
MLGEIGLKAISTNGEVKKGFFNKLFS